LLLLIKNLFSDTIAIGLCANTTVCMDMCDTVFSDASEEYFDSGNYNYEGLGQSYRIE